METLADRALAYVAAQRVSGAPYGRYLYAAGMAAPVLYASTYAAMTRHLCGELDSLGGRERAEWIAYLQSHQDDDGLFRDPAIYGQGWYAGDPEWCGRRHLSCHVVTALTCLGAVAVKAQTWLEPFCAPGGIERWLERRTLKRARARPTERTLAREREGDASGRSHRPAAPQHHKGEDNAAQALLSRQDRAQLVHPGWHGELCGN